MCLFLPSSPFTHTSEVMTTVDVSSDEISYYEVIVLTNPKTEMHMFIRIYIFDYSDVFVSTTIRGSIHSP